jgi:hypothetical protein
MASILYKWLIVFALFGFTSDNHPIFVSVTEIEHNTKEKTLQVSCKIFTDDFETTLRKKYNVKIDLLDMKQRTAMGPMVSDYVQKHLAIVADGKKVVLEFLGFEQDEEGIVSYYEVKNITSVKKLDVTDNILYDEKPQQMQIIHVIVNGERKSSRLNNPDAKAAFEF